MDNRPTILVAFANNPEQPLKYLKTEMDGIQRIMELQDLSFRIRIVYDATIPKIEEKIKECGDHIVAFMYSGHANGASIDTKEHPIHAKGLANELQKCKNLQIVILNGCKSAGHIKYIEPLGIPILIATKSAVGDWPASRFSVILFKELFDGKTIGEAFKEALAKAESYEGEIGNLEILSRFLEEANMIDNTWLLILKNEENKNWNIFDEIDKFKIYSDYKPNQLLKEFLYTELSKLNPKVDENASYEDAQLEIFKSFPQFISKFIYDLCAEPIENINAGERYDTISMRRLEKCVQFYCSIQEVLLSIALSEIREIFIKPPQVTTTPIALTLSEIVSKKFNKIQYLKASLAWLDSFHSILFVEELKEIDMQSMNEVADSFEKINENISNNNSLHLKLLADLCERAENMLIKLLKLNLFLTNYQFLSIKNITVYKNRTYPKARYGFNMSVYEWVSPQKNDAADKAEKSKIESTPDNFSVLMIKTGNAWASIESNNYLNLSPFLIDKNIKYENSKLTHISYLNTVANNEYTYESLLASSNKLVISDSNNNKEMQFVFNDIHEQFTHFNRLIATKNEE